MISQLYRIIKDWLDGNISTAKVTLATGDIELGAVEIKNATTDDRAVVSAAGNLKTEVAVALPAGTANIGDVDVLTIAAGDTNIGNVDIVTVPAPLSTTGGGLEATALRVTLASDSTGVVSVDDNAGSLTVDGTVTANAGTDLNTSALALETTATSVKTAVELIDDAVYTDGTGTPSKAIAVAGTDGTNPQILKTDTAGELQVDVLSIAAGSNNIGDVDVLSIAAGDNNIGNVDIVTVPAPLNVVGTGLEATALRVTIATDSTGVLSVDDNAGSLTIDGSVSVTGAVDTELPAAGVLVDNTPNENFTVPGVAALNMVFDGTNWNRMRSTGGVVQVGDNAASLTIDNTALTTADLDTDVGTDTRGVIGLLGSASGGGQLIPGSSTDGLLVNLGTNNDVTVTGTVTANAGTNLNTSALALETTATSIKTAVELIDDAVYTDGTGTPSKAVGVAGTDGTNPQILKTDTAGELQVDVLSIAAGSNNIGDVDVLSIAAGDNNIGNVDIVTVPAPLSVTGTGTEAAALRVTIATDSTGVLSVDDNAGSLTVDGTVTANAGTNLNTSALALETTATSVKTAVELVDDTVVADDAAFTPATTKVVMAGYEFDDATTDVVDEGDAGAARIDASRRQLVRLVGATDANRADVDASGFLQVDIAADSVGIGGGTQYAVDTALGATPTGTLSVAIRDDALSALTPVEGDAIGLRVDANGALWTHDDALDAALGGSELQVDVVGALPAGANKIGAVDLDSDATIAAAVPTVAQFVAGTDGTNARALKTDTGGELQVDVLTLPALVAGTANIGDIDVLSIAAGDNNIGNVDIVTVPAPLSTTGGGTEATALRVTIASDSTGLVSIDDNAGSLTVDQATHDNLNLNANLQIANADASATNPVPVRPNEFELAGVTTHVTKYYTSAGAVTDGIVWSPAAGKRWYVVSMYINVSAAATVTIEDDVVAGDVVFFKSEFAANSGVSHYFGDAPLFSGEDAADLLITTSAGNVYVTVTGYEI